MRKALKLSMAVVLFLAASQVALSLNWQVETVDWYGNAGLHPSLTLDSNGNPHTASVVKYGLSPAGADSYFHDIHYATRNETGWDPALVARSSFARGLSLALTADDQPGIVGHLPLRWFEREDGTWTGTDTGVGGDYVANPDYCLRIRDGVPAVAYGGYETILYAERAGGTWSETVVQPDEYPGGCSRYLSKDSLAFDSLGRPHIAYAWESEERLNNVLKYAYREGDEWVLETVASLEIEKSGWYSKPAIILDGNDVKRAKKSR